ncbi:MAG: undecaprenyl-phosphate glucose phosphotransferase [Magnetococcus sp. DMHC-6]
MERMNWSAQLYFQRLIIPLTVFGSLVGVNWALFQELTKDLLRFGVVMMVLSFYMFRETEFCISMYDCVSAKGGRIFKTWGLIVGIVLFIQMAFKVEFVQPDVMTVWIFVTPLTIFLMQTALKKVIVLYFNQPKYRKKVVVIGGNYSGIRFANEVKHNSFLEMTFMGFFDDRSMDRLGSLIHEEFIGTISESVNFVVENHIDMVYIALPMSSQHRIFKLLEELENTTASVYFIPDVKIFDLVQARFDTINGIPIVAVCETPFYGINAIKKRLFDIVVSIFALILLFPLMLAIGIAVKMTSPGPALFFQRRYGLGGNEIRVAKFRSMKVMEDGGEVVQATLGDSRITRVGSFLRRTSLDELPQFYNVLIGEMSIVGPRPHAVSHNEAYRKLIKGYMARHKALPGITGWAQVNGLRGEITRMEDMESRINYDLDYLRCWSLSFDVWIVLKTIYVVIQGNRAY